jgi:hypothetical protein
VAGSIGLEFECICPDFTDQNKMPFIQREKLLTKEIWDEYSGKKCDQGVSFENCVFPCLSIPNDSQVNDCGLLAGSPDSFKSFPRVFEKYLKNIGFDFNNEK